jgi:hypothetical protein
MANDILYAGLQNRISQLEKLISATQVQIAAIQDSVKSCIRLSDLKNSENNTAVQTNSLKSITNSLEQRLSMVKLPEETRYYLEESEVVSFRSNFTKLAAMMADFEKLYSNLVAYNSNK